MLYIYDKEISDSTWPLLLRTAISYSRLLRRWLAFPTVLASFLLPVFISNFSEPVPGLVAD